MQPAVCPETASGCSLSVFPETGKGVEFLLPYLSHGSYSLCFFLVRLPSFSARTQGDKSGTYGWVILMFLPHNPLIHNDLSALCLIFD